MLLGLPQGHQGVPPAGPPRQHGQGMLPQGHPHGHRRGQQGVVAVGEDAVLRALPGGAQQEGEQLPPVAVRGQVVVVGQVEPAPGPAAAGGPGAELVDRPDVAPAPFGRALPLLPLGVHHHGGAGPAKQRVGLVEALAGAGGAHHRDVPGVRIPGQAAGAQPVGRGVGGAPQAAGRRAPPPRGRGSPGGRRWPAAPRGGGAGPGAGAAPPRGGAPGCGRRLPPPAWSGGPGPGPRPGRPRPGPGGARGGAAPARRRGRARGGWRGPAPTAAPPAGRAGGPPPRCGRPPLLPATPPSRRPSARTRGPGPPPAAGAQGQGEEHEGRRGGHPAQEAGQAPQDGRGAPQEAPGGPQGQAQGPGGHPERPADDPQPDGQLPADRGQGGHPAGHEGGGQPAEPEQRGGGVGDGCGHHSSRSWAGARSRVGASRPRSSSRSRLALTEGGAEVGQLADVQAPGAGGQGVGVGVVPEVVGYHVPALEVPAEDGPVVPRLQPPLRVGAQHHPVGVGRLPRGGGDLGPGVGVVELPPAVGVPHAGALAGPVLAVAPGVVGHAAAQAPGLGAGGVAGHHDGHRGGGHGYAASSGAPAAGAVFSSASSPVGAGASAGGASGRPSSARASRRRRAAMASRRARRFMRG